MPIKKAVGRSNKMDYRLMIRLADAIQHNATVREACAFTGVSHDCYYRYLKNNEVFRQKMEIAKSNQNKAVFSFMTIL